MNHQRLADDIIELNFLLTQLMYVKILLCVAVTKEWFSKGNKTPSVGIVSHPVLLFSLGQTSRNDRRWMHLDLVMNIRAMSVDWDKQVALKYTSTGSISACKFSVGWFDALEGVGFHLAKLVDVGPLSFEWSIMCSGWAPRAAASTLWGLVRHTPPTHIFRHDNDGMLFKRAGYGLWSRRWIIDQRPILVYTFNWLMNGISYCRKIKDGSGLSK